jgi:cation diffusion facilitator family transporter
MSLGPHHHNFISQKEKQAEKRTWLVVALTLMTMILEIVMGLWTGSMALLADGWHMGTHAVAMGMAASAYLFARRHAQDPRFTFGTGKINPLAGYTSALLLALAGLWMGYESIHRLFNPVEIDFSLAIWIAVFGLIINVASAFILGHDHDHAHTQESAHESSHVHDAQTQDHNLRAAYLHVLTDALTSVLAIISLTLGLLYGWVVLDPLMGVLGALFILVWGFNLAKDSAKVLVDAEDHSPTQAEIRQLIDDIEDWDVQMTDLHIWRLGTESLGVILSLATDQPEKAEYLRGRIEQLPLIKHLTLEVFPLSQCACADPAQ